MSGPESPSSVEEGRQARWARALADERAETLSGRVGPCHAMGGAGHRCDSAPRWVTVSIDGGPTEAYRWCDRALVGAHNAVSSGSIVTSPGVRCPDCGGDPCNEGRELLPTYRLVDGVMTPDGGTDICEHDCHDHDHDREED